MLKVLKYSQKVIQHTLLAFALLLALPLAFSSFSTNSFVNKAFAAFVGADFTVDNVRYVVLSISGSNGTVEVSGTISTDIDIPTLVTSSGKNYNVTSIAANAFRDNISLRSVVLPDSVTTIDEAAFRGATALTSIILPDSVTTIGEAAFRNATALESVTLSSNLTEIFYFAFAGTTSLTHIDIPVGVTVIRSNAFLGSGLSSITLPDSVTTIDYTAFAGSKLTDIDIPNSVTSIGVAAFAKTTSLETVRIGNQVTSIGDGAFQGASALVDLVIGDQVTSIGTAAFEGTTSLKAVTIPASVTSIGARAFADSGLTAITLKTSSATIDPDAFIGTVFENVDFNNTIDIDALNSADPNGVFSYENGTLIYTHAPRQSIVPQDYPDAQASSLEIMNNILAVNNINSTVESIRFFSMLINDAVGIGTKNPKEVVRILESVLRVDQVAAVSNMGIGASLSASSNVTNYLSQAGFSLASSGGQAPVVVRKDESLENEFLQDALLQEGMAAGSLEADESIKNGLALWLLPMYKYSRVSGISVGAFEHGYDSSLGGMSLGADYTFDNAFRVGLAFNLGTGSAESTGDLSKTDSDFDFWGLSLYGAYYKDKFSLMADIGYSAVKGESSQEVPAVLGSSSLEADTDSDVWTLGLTAEYIFETKFVDIRPHVGIRYMNIDVADYDTKNTAGIIAQTKSESQDVWYFPVGVTFSTDFESESNWVFTPSADLGFIAAAGDLDATSISTIPGVAGSTKSTMQTVDDFAFSGGVGLNLANKDKGISFGFNYNLQASKHETGHLFNASFRYEFQIELCVFK